MSVFIISLLLAQDDLDSLFRDLASDRIETRDLASQKLVEQLLRKPDLQPEIDRRSAESLDPEVRARTRAALDEVAMRRARVRLIPHSTLEPLLGVPTVLVPSPSGEYLASSGSDHRIYVYSIRDQRQIADLQASGFVASFCWGSNGKILAASTAMDPKIYIWSAENFSLDRTIALKDPVSQIRLSPDGSILAGISREDTITLLEVSSGNVRVIPGLIEKDSIFLGWVDNKSLLLASQHDTRARIYTMDPISEKVTTCWEGGNAGHRLTNAAVNASHSLFAYRNDNRCEVWNFRSGDRVFAIQSRDTAKVSFHGPDHLLLWNGGVVERFKIPDVLPIQRFDARGDVKSVVPVGDAVAVTSDKRILIWSLSGDVATTFSPIHHSMMFDVAFSRNGQNVAICDSGSGSLRLWSLVLNRQLASVPIPRYSMVRFSPDGNCVIVSFQDTVYYYSSATLELMHTIKTQRKPTNGPMATSPDSRKLVYSTRGFLGGDLVLAAAGGGELARKETGAEIWGSLEFSLDGMLILVAGTDTELLNAANLETVERLSSGECFVACFSRDGKYIVTLSGENELAIYDLATRRKLASIQELPVRDCSTLVDLHVEMAGRVIVTTGKDGCIRIFAYVPQTASLICLKRIDIAKPIKVSLSDDGTRFGYVTWNRPTTLHTFMVQPEN